MLASSPYADINAQAIRAGMRAPSLASEPRRDPITAPSIAETRVRNARLAAAIIASVAFRATVARRGDYATHRPTLHGPFHTAR